MTNHWHIIGHASELANEGDYICLPVEPGREIAVTRQRGEVFAFDNRCPHRGARIFTELRGNRASTCAYHGRFVHSGCVRLLPLVLSNGWIFAASEYGGQSIEGAFGTGMLSILNTAPAALRPHSTLTIDMRCHWTVAIENALDYEHVEHVHSNSLGALGIKPGPLLLVVGGSSAHRFVSSRASALDRLSRLFERSEKFDYLHAHFFPASCVSSTRGLTYSLQNYLPRQDGTTLFVHRLYAAPALSDVSSYLSSVQEVNARTFWEDTKICEITPAGHDGPLLGERDQRIAHFRAHVARTA